MMSAADARKLAQHIWMAQWEQIERAIKETIIMGGTCIYYKTDMLDKATIEWLKILGYKVQVEDYNSTKISWEV